ncbi:hypothetical protein V6X02_05625 [Spiribacter sp. 1M153]|uniref:hypothetical protein n=1 Tax=Spiribacter roseus TaxID=1855875 RepID=UPI00349F303A
MSNPGNWMQRFVIALGLILATTNALAQDEPFAALRDGGHVLMLRHAIAPGFGDPAGFDVDDCTT